MSTTLLAKLIAAGVSPDLVAEVAELAAELNVVRKRRRADSARKRIKRADQQIAVELTPEPIEAVALSDMSADIPDVQDIPDPSPPKKVSPITPSKNHPPNLDDDGGGGPAKSLITPEAIAITDALIVIAGVDPEFVPPGWCGAAMRVQAWLTQGWSADAILAGAKAAMGRKRDGPPDTVNYFEKPIARAFAAQSAPIPTANIVPFSENNHGRPNGSNGITAARDRAFAHLDAIIQRGRGGAS